MKPKNRIMCPDCGRPKMLFESEKAANNFLKFNMNEVNPDGKREMRVYYCPACCGYHISSHQYKGGNRTEKLISAYRNDLAKGHGTDIVAVCDLLNALRENGFETRKEVNDFLRKKTGFTQATLDKVRQKYYKEKGI